MAYCGNGKNPRRTTVASVLLAVCFALPGCSGVAPTPEKAQVQNETTKYAQAMRMAASVRAGGDNASAAVFYHRAHLLEPRRPEPLVGLAETAVLLGAHDDALKFFRQALALDGATAEVRRSYGTLLLTTGLSTHALDVFRQAAAQDPKDPRSYNGMGIALDLLGRQPEAQDAYAQGLGVTPSNATLRNNLALSKAIAGDYAGAIAMLEEIASEPGSGARVRQNLALVYALAGRIREAAAVAGRDLSAEELRNNVALYKALSGLPARELAAVIFGIGDTSADPVSAYPSVPRSAESASLAVRRRARLSARATPVPTIQLAPGKVSDSTKPELSRNGSPATSRARKTSLDSQHPGVANSAPAPVIDPTRPAPTIVPLEDISVPVADDPPLAVAEAALPPAASTNNAAISPATPAAPDASRVEVTESTEEALEATLPPIAMATDVPAPTTPVPVISVEPISIQGYASGSPPEDLHNHQALTSSHSSSHQEGSGLSLQAMPRRLGLGLIEPVNQPPARMKPQGSALVVLELADRPKMPISWMSDASPTEHK